MPLGASGCYGILDGDKGVAFLELGAAVRGRAVTSGCAAVVWKVSFLADLHTLSEICVLIPAEPKV